MKADSPVKTKDKDILERYNFAYDIVSGLLKTFETGQDSIAIGLIGEWGFGKSSFLEFIEAEINNQTKAETTLNVIFRFNPWLFKGQSDLQRIFLTQLGIRLRIINSELTQLGKDYLMAANIIDTANKWNPNILWSNLIRGGTNVIKYLIKTLNNETTIETLKTKVDRVLEDSKIKVFVIIDDIDS